MILCIETATPLCSVALVHNGKFLACFEDRGGQNHSKIITQHIEFLMCKCGVSYSQLDAVAVSMGPGSYTGLRIGVSTAKGFCYGLSKPLIAIDTLHAMAYGGKPLVTAENPVFVPMIDARRMEVYAEVFDKDLNKIEETKAMIINEESFSELKKEHDVFLFGDGADKCAELFVNDNKINVIRNFSCSARYMDVLAQQKFDANDFVDAAYFEPFYLKDFVPGVPVVKGLR